MSNEENTRSDAQVRADETARIESSASIESSVVGSGVTVAERRAQPDASVERAETRGIYLTPDGRRKVVGAGDPVPAGWRRVESAVLADRVGEVPTNQDDPAGTATSAGGPSESGSSKPKTSRSSSSSSSSGSGSDDGGGSGSDEVLVGELKVADYEKANAEDVAKMLAAAPQEYAQAVLDYEKGHKKRKTVTDAADKRLAELKSS